MEKEWQFSFGELASFICQLLWKKLITPERVPWKSSKGASVRNIEDGSTLFHVTKIFMGRLTVSHLSILELEFRNEIVARGMHVNMFIWIEKWDQTFSDRKNSDLAD